MILIDELVAEHVILWQLADEFEAEVAKADMSAGRVSELRWSLTRKLTEHLVKEDRIFYPKLTNCPNARIADLARRFSAEMGGLSEAYQNYVRNWPLLRIQEDTKGFRDATKQVLTALRLRIQREENELFKFDVREVACFNNKLRTECVFQSDPVSRSC